MTRHLLAAPGQPDTAAAARSITDGHKAARLLSAQIDAGNETATRLASVLLSAGLLVAPVAPARKRRWPR